MIKNKILMIRIEIIYQFIIIISSYKLRTNSMSEIKLLLYL